MSKKITTEEFIEKAKIIHGDKYDYSLVNYIRAKTNVEIICPTHGVFTQRPTNHLSKKGCPKCANNVKLTTEEFIEKSKMIHGDKYDYSLVNYINIDTPITIKCPTHDEFNQIPYTHSIGHGCPKCRTSKGESLIMNYLNSKSIEYIYEHSFSDCKYKTKLRFDFFLPQYNTCIEYDGIQHFKSVPLFGGIKYLKELKVRDEIKNNYCINNNIKLLRIRYDEDIITSLDSYFSTSIMFIGSSQ